jgi:hypothetical protein
MAHYEVSTDPIDLPASCGCCEGVVSVVCPCGTIEVPTVLFISKTGDTCSSGAWNSVANGTTWQMNFCRTDSGGVPWWGADLTSICTSSGGELCRWLMLGVICNGLSGFMWRVIMTDDDHGCNGVLDPVICGANGLFVFTGCSPTFPLTGFGLVAPWNASCCDASGQVDFEVTD